MEKQNMEYKLKTLCDEINQLLERAHHHGNNVVMETDIYGGLLLDAHLQMESLQTTPTEKSSSVKDFPLAGSFLVNLEKNKNENFSTHFIECTQTLSRHLIECSPSPHPSHYDNCLCRLFEIIKLLTIFDDQSKITEDYISSIMTSLDEFILEWENSLTNSPSSLSFLLDLVIVILAQSIPQKGESPSLEGESLPLEDVVHFIRNHLRVLMNYSLEGFLSNNPEEFFVKLLEFVASLVESGYSPSETIEEVLPHLFGPFFGVCDHNISCLLLEYGKLSICSKYKDKLMNEGLRHLVTVWKLFPSLDRIAIQRRASVVHTESLNVCMDIVNELINELCDNYQFKNQNEESHDQKEESHDQTEESHDQSEESNDQTEESHDQSEESRDQSHDQNEESHDQSHDLSDITEDARAKDKKDRILLLSSLLELACAMVSENHIFYTHIDCYPSFSNLLFPKCCYFFPLFFSPFLSPFSLYYLYR